MDHYFSKVPHDSDCGRRIFVFLFLRHLSKCQFYRRCEKADMDLNRKPTGVVIAASRRVSRSARRSQTPRCTPCIECGQIKRAIMLTTKQRGAQYKAHLLMLFNQPALLPYSFAKEPGKKERKNSVKP